MALQHRDPNTIHLGGDITKLNEWIAGVQITPGMLIEFYDNGTMMLRPHASATEIPGSTFALEKIIHNKTVDDVYPSGELVYAATFHRGSSVWALIPSGQNISAGELLQSNGNGMLKSATATTAAAGLAKFQALEDLGAITVTTRCRVAVL